ncbi:MAG: hypothetical protein HY820_16795 [Acidobacteria bacterium]|nr:hypothetical protein [Acidobacteriota bacterium]
MSVGSVRLNAAANHNVLATLAGPIASIMYTGGCRAGRSHEWVVALHEAAHAAVATALSIRVKEVSFLPGDGTLGHCRYHGDPPRGAIPRSDTSKALAILRLSHGCSDWRETRRHLRSLRRRAEDLVRGDLYPIHRLAEALRERYKLSGEEAEDPRRRPRRTRRRVLPGAGFQPVDRWHAVASHCAKTG